MSFIMKLPIRTKTLTNRRMKCCICNKEIIGKGNNPQPLRQNGRCCDVCNFSVVKERLRKSFLQKNKLKDLKNYE